MARRPLRDKDKYYPGSPWGEHPPQEMEPRQAQLPPGTTVTTTTINGMKGSIVDAAAPSGNVILLPQDAGRHIDAYFEYRQLVGDSDGGRLLPEAEYEALRARAADPSRRVWAHWVETSSGLECRAIGPNSMCFCGHRYREHTWDSYPETHVLQCKMQGCSCRAFSFIPVRGTGDVKCSVCKRSYLDHDPRTKRCDKGAGTFKSSYSCSCNSTYDMHRTVVQTNAEREATGKLTNAPWMGAAAATGLPTAHMGGVGSFTSLADGIDRALAGVEPGFEPQRVYDSLTRDTHGIKGQRSLESVRQSRGNPTATVAYSGRSSEYSLPRSGNGAGNATSSGVPGRCPRPPVPRDRSGPLPAAGSGAVTGSGSRPSSGRSGSQQLPRKAPIASNRGRSAGQVFSNQERVSRARSLGSEDAVDTVVQDSLSSLSARELAALAKERGIDLTGCLEKADVLERLRDSPY